LSNSFVESSSAQNSFSSFGPSRALQVIFGFVREPFMLDLPRSDDAGADFCGRFAVRSPEFRGTSPAALQRADHPVEQRAGNPSEITLDFSRRRFAFTGIFPSGVGSSRRRA